MNSIALSLKEPTDDKFVLAEVLGGFTGVAVGSDRIEQLMAGHIRKEYFNEIAETAQTKWWDYQRMAPGHSFMFFVHNYYKYFKIYGNKMLAYRGSNDDRRFIVGPNQMQYTAAEIWDRDQRHITGMLRGMLACDALYMPYDDYCSFAFRIAVDRAWTRLPNPTQIYADDLLDCIITEWDAHKKVKARLAVHPVYRVDNYCGLPIQDRYRAWLIERIQEFSDKMPVIHRAVYELEQLTEQDAYNHFPAADVKRASIIANR